jgi:hypothetical protein
VLLWLLWVTETSSTILPLPPPSSSLVMLPTTTKNKHSWWSLTAWSHCMTFSFPFISLQTQHTFLSLSSFLLPGKGSQCENIQNINSCEN